MSSVQIFSPGETHPFRFTGIELPDENIGKTTNKGIEISALHRRTISKGFQYRIGGQFTYAKNEIVFIDESPFVPEYQKEREVQLIIFWFTKQMACIKIRSK